MDPSERFPITLGEAIFSLRAIRRVKPDPIPEDDLRDILTATIQAPNGGNAQPWHFLAVRDAGAAPAARRTLPRGVVGEARRSGHPRPGGHRPIERDDGLGDEAGRRVRRGAADRAALRDRPGSERHGIGHSLGAEPACSPPARSASAARSRPCTPWSMSAQRSCWESPRRSRSSTPCRSATRGAASDRSPASRSARSPQSTAGTTRSGSRRPAPAAVPRRYEASSAPTSEKLVMATSPSGNSATIFSRPPTASM